MSEYVIGIFPTYQDAKKAVELLENEKMANEIVILSRLTKFNTEESSLKLDGVISGVSDVFIGLPVFVNPMSTVGLPPQNVVSTVADSQWAQYGFSKEEALKYQDLMSNGKTIIAVKSENREEPIKECLNRFGVEKTMIHSS